MGTQLRLPDAVPRVAVTGVGMVSALGHRAREAFDRACAGESGFAPLGLLAADRVRTRFAAEVRDIERLRLLEARGEQRLARSDRMALAAAAEAAAAAGLPAASGRLGVAVGATTGGLFDAEARLDRVQDASDAFEAARLLLENPLSAAADRIAAALGARRATTVCSACSSAANAIVLGAAWLLLDEVDQVLAGGVDALCGLTLAGFDALGAVDASGCRPFDRQRAGLGLGEGAAFLVLERDASVRARGARPIAWLSGWAIGSEAHHVTHPEPSGATAARLVGEALARAGLQPRDIDWVNAHGTGTAQNDAMEALALRAALGDELDRIFVSSQKGQLGHALGAAGALEAAITVLALQQQRVPPTGGLRDPDPSLGLRHVIGSARQAPLRAALSSSFGFGGVGCVLALEAATAPARAARVAPARLAITGAAVIERDELRLGVDCASLEQGSHCSPRDRVPALDPARSRRFDRGSEIAALGASAACRDAALDPATCGLLLGTAYGNVERSLSFLARIAQKGARLASPAEFPHLLASAPAGNASIYAGLRGPVMTTCDLSLSGESAVHAACDLVAAGAAPAMIAGGVEPPDAFVDRLLGPPRIASGAAGLLLVEPWHAACGRGARVFAELLGRGLASDADEHALLEEVGGPRDAPRSLVIVLARIDEPPWRIADTAWHGVRRIELAVGARPDAAAAGLALAAAAAMVARGDVDEVLVASRVAGRASLLRFGAPR